MSGRLLVVGSLRMPATGREPQGGADRGPAREFACGGVHATARRSSAAAVARCRRDLLQPHSKSEVYGATAGEDRSAVWPCGPCRQSAYGYGCVTTTRVADCRPGAPTPSAPRRCSCSWGSVVSYSAPGDLMTDRRDASEHRPKPGLARERRHWRGRARDPRELSQYSAPTVPCSISRGGRYGAGRGRGGWRTRRDARSSKKTSPASKAGRLCASSRHGHVLTWVNRSGTEEELRQCRGLVRRRWGGSPGAGGAGRVAAGPGRVAAGRGHAPPRGGHLPGPGRRGAAPAGSRRTRSAASGSP